VNARATWSNGRTVKGNGCRTLSFKQLKVISMWYGKFENVCEVQRHCRLEFAMKPPTWLTNTRIRDQLEAQAKIWEAWHRSFSKEELQVPCTSTCFRHPFYLSFINPSALWEEGILLPTRWRTTTLPPRRQKLPRWNPTWSMYRTKR
jgi:hypothetical protein